MLDFLYQSAWGAFTIMLFFQIPFLIVFFYIVYRKSHTDPGPSGTDEKRISRIEGSVDYDRGGAVHRGERHQHQVHADRVHGPGRGLRVGHPGC